MKNKRMVQRCVGLALVLCMAALLMPCFLSSSSAHESVTRLAGSNRFDTAFQVADAMKANGWEFASHTWGHLHIGDASLESIKKDTEKWLTYVAPLVGGTDTIIFAHGQDIADWHDYASDNEKFQYLKSQGFNIFCNVDSSQYFLQIRDNYLRMGRRNLDGYRLWNDVHGGTNRTSDLFDANQILDSARTDMPSL